MRAFIFALAVAACSTSTREELPPPQLPQRAGIDPSVAARAEGVQFQATGADFVLQVYRQDRIVLTRGDRELTFAKTAPTLPRWNGEIYETRNEAHELRVEIRRSSCRDERSSETFSARVLVVIDGEELRGCGRDF